LPSGDAARSAPFINTLSDNGNRNRSSGCSDASVAGAVSRAGLDRPEHRPVGGRSLRRFLAAQTLTFARPDDSNGLAAVLVLRIVIWAALASFTSDIDELALGIGGIVLGV
jgi:hypothetical protein